MMLVISEAVTEESSFIGLFIIVVLLFIVFHFYLFLLLQFTDIDLKEVLQNNIQVGSCAVHVYSTFKSSCITYCVIL